MNYLSNKCHSDEQIARQNFIRVTQPIACIPKGTKIKLSTVLADEIDLEDSDRIEVIERSHSTVLIATKLEYEMNDIVSSMSKSANIQRGSLTKNPFYEEDVSKESGEASELDMALPERVSNPVIMDEGFVQATPLLQT